MISNKLTGLFIAATLGLSACGGGSSSSSAGTQVDIFARFSAVDGQVAQPAGSKSFSNSEGRAIRIQRGFLVIWSVEMKLDCTDPDFVFNNPFKDIIGNAYAHTSGDPQTLGVPSVLSLTAADESMFKLGELSPAVGGYCGVHAELLKSDDDALNLPTDIDMVDRVIYLEGEFLADDNVTWMPFTIDSGIALLPAKRRFPLQLSLNKDNPDSNIRISIDYANWFDGVDFSQLQTTTQENLILGNVTASLTAEWF